MDGKRFDALIKGLGRTRLTRLRAVQGLAAATAVGVSGISLAAGGTEAADRKKRKRTICHCGDNNPQQINCVTKRLRRKRARRHLRRHAFDYKGTCRKEPKPGAGCTPADNTRGSCLEGQICNRQGICVSAGCLNPDTLCPGGDVCCGANTDKAGQCKPNENAC